MTFSPRKKQSRSKSRIRTTAWTKRTALKLLRRTKLQYDASGEAVGLTHLTSPITGEYRGKKVMDIKTKKANVVRA